MTMIKLISLLILLSACASARRFSNRAELIRAPYQPFQVFVVCSGKSFIFGSGVAVTNRHILTTASLLKDYDEWKVGYGSAILEHLTYMESRFAFIHPNYNELTRDSNLGIIVLPGILPSIVQQIELPQASYAALPRLNEEGTIIGFGAIKDTPGDVVPNSFLKTAFLLTMADASCRNFMPNLNTNFSFCAKDEQTNSMNVCKGDGGSAFVVSYRGRQVLAGIASIISNTCKSSEPTAFVRIQKFTSWIRSVTLSNHTSI